jgi:hypothetical protein
MGYTIGWTQYAFTDYTYNNVTSLVARVTSAATKFRQEPWGFVLGIDDDNSFCVERRPTQMTYCKTNRMAYTKDAMKALILMVEFGAAAELVHDDTDMTWYLDALDAVHAVVPLASYTMQKAYFMGLHKARVA